VKQYVLRVNVMSQKHGAMVGSGGDDDDDAKE
jgi:hypothetical protein